MDRATRALKAEAALASFLAERGPALWDDEKRSIQDVLSILRREASK